MGAQKGPSHKKPSKKTRVKREGEKPGATIARNRKGARGKKR